MYQLETLNKLLKKELSAMETYQRILDKLRKNVVLSEFEYILPIYKAHKDVVTSLQALISKLGVAPAEDSGSFGAGWSALRSSTKLGKKAVLKTLQAVEKSGAENYEKVLQDPELPSDIRYLIEWKLRYGQQSNVRTLDRLLATA